MADLDDVLEALSDAVTAAVYPEGSSSPSVTGDLITIYPGWPDASELEHDLEKGRVHVSVYPTEIERDDTRYFVSDVDELAVPQPTITRSISGTSFTLGGQVAVPQNVAVIVNSHTSGGVFSVAVLADDTLSTLAARLASTLSTGGIPATSSGPTVNVPSATLLKVRIGVWGTVARDLRQVARVIQIIVWSSSLASRRGVSRAIDIAMAKTVFLPLSDGTKARVKYRASKHLDKWEKANLFRRDFHLEVEYSTIETETVPQIIADVVNL